MRHKSPLLNFSATAISFICILAMLLAPNALGLLAPYLLFISVFLIGIPHGAIDHVIAAEVYNVRQSVMRHILFYASYLLIMLVIGLLWIYLPAVGMIFFLGISIYHFGQADILSFTNKSGFVEHILYLSRGLLIIGLILFSFPQISLPIVAVAIQQPQDFFESWYSLGGDLALVSIAQHIIVLLLLARRTTFTVPFWRIIADTVIVASLLFFTHPLVGFAIYFALWHSVGHVREMLDFFAQKGKQVSLFDFYKLALPFTLISLLGLLMLYGLVSVWTDLEYMIPLLFILISVLTLPHMIVADRMFHAGKVSN